VIDAEAGTLTGEDAVYRLLTWSEGEFEVVFRTVRRREVIQTSSQGLLMEGMRRLDEWSRILEQLPPLNHRFEIDAGELAVRLGDVPDDHNRILRLIDGKRTLLEVMDASDVGDLECIQAIAKLYFEELLLDLDHGVPKKRDTGKMVPLVEIDAPTPIEESVSGPIPRPSLDTGRVSEASILSEEPAQTTQPVAAGDVVHEQDAEPAHSDEPAALMGSYRPSSLRLIDEAVAAAQAIDPLLFDDMADASSVPREIEADEPSAPPPRRTKRVSAPPPPEPAPRRSNDESGLRMIGSLGRDRAEASGELMPPGSPPNSSPMPEGQRELVTILPRRITREMAAVQPPADAAPATATEPPSDKPEPTKTDTPRPRIQTPPRGVSVAGGVVARSTGPSGAALALIILAALLAGTAVFLLVKKSGKHEVAEVHDAGDVVADLPDARGMAGGNPDAAFVEELDAAEERPHDAWEPPKGDAGRAATVAPDAAVKAPPDAAVIVPPDAAVKVPADAAVPMRTDAGVTGGDAGQDPTQQAKVLMQQATEANQEGDFEKALALANSSLKLRRTARAYLVRAQALQRLDRIDDALESVDSAEELAPDYASVFEMRGSILWAAGRFDAARRVYARFLELEPDSARAAQIRKRIDEPH
jgi:Flp pilus assembly protein TadD